MKQIAKFYTLFWILYFPLCIAYYDEGLTNIVDEVMTVILIGYTFTKFNNKGVSKEAKKEYMQYYAIFFFFIAYGLLFGANIPNAVWRDAVQWVRPFSVIYCTWILNPQFTRKQQKWMLYSMIVTMISWIFYHPEIAKGNAEFVVLGQMAMCTGMTWYLFKNQNKTNIYIAIIIVLSGFLAPKVKYIGEVVCFIYFVLFMTSKPNLRSKKTLTTIVVLCALVLFFTWDKFDAYYVTGMTQEEKLARPESYKVAWRLLWDYFPFGPGMGSFGVAAAADYYSPLYYKYELSDIWGLTPQLPMFVADAFYPALANIGIVGISIFCIFWKRRLHVFNKIIDLRYYRVAWITFFCLVIEQTADTSFLSGKGMGYCMLIGLCMNANRNMIKNQRAEENDEVNESRSIYGENTRRRNIVITRQ